MKLAEIYEDAERLDEISFKQAAAAGLIGAATLFPAKLDKTSEPSQEYTQQVRAHHQAKVQTETLAQGIARRYRIAFQDALRIVKTAMAHSKPTFPKTEDILAVIGIESSFDPSKKSGLRKDPAVGLMQVRPGVWAINPRNLQSIDGQIRTGVDILSKYYDKLKDVDATLNAYNVGITNHRRGVENAAYVGKFHAEKQELQKIKSVAPKKNR